MATYPSYDQRQRWVVTDAGHQAAAELETCQCRWEFDQGMVVCHDCGTVYSTMVLMARQIGRGPEVRR